MAISIRFTGGDSDEVQAAPCPLTSATGWTHFGQWVAALPDTFVHVKQLAEDGSCLGTDALADDLTAALAAWPPDEDVREVAERIIDAIGVGDADEVAAVVDDDDDGDTLVDLGGTG